MGSVLELILADSRTPTGGYAHSAGLEQMIADGGSVEDVPAFVRARLRTVAGVDAAFAAAACRVRAVADLLALDAELAARTPAAPLRAASRNLGRALLRTALAWWPGDPGLTDYRDRSSLTPRPLVLGAVVARGGGDPLGAARISLYEDAATVCSAAVKLLPLDSGRSSRWLVALAGEIEDLAGDAARAAAGPDLPSSSAPLLDRSALIHATTSRRLFAS
jgi:urease accessory protein